MSEEQLRWFAIELLSNLRSWVRHSDEYQIMLFPDVEWDDGRAVDILWDDERAVAVLDWIEGQLNRIKTLDDHMQAMARERAKQLAQQIKELEEELEERRARRLIHRSNGHEVE